MCANDLKRPGIQRAHRLNPLPRGICAKPKSLVGSTERGARIPHNVGLPEVDTGGREAPGTALRKGPFLRHAVLPADPIWPSHARPTRWT